MSQYLVLTAIGADRTGIVSELTKLACECGCNILDSRMAIFGNEFSFIMLLNGNSRSINQIELRLPKLAHSLELITMMKRTSGYKKRNLTQHFEVTYAGIDQPGVLKAVTAFFAARKIDISSLNSHIDINNNQTNSHILIALTDKVSIDHLENEFLQLCEQIGVQGCIKAVQSNLLNVS
ncbi:MAG: transcriptional regulator [Gammaproteobacteria bacterium]|nr:MAG: transcriptional regulator [Gammaproteobacteria bacterium]